MLNKKEREVYKEKGEKLLDAIAFGSLARVKTLIENGADVNFSDNKYRYTPMHVAATEGKIEIARYLLKLGANINGKDKNGYSVLHEAIAPSKKASKNGNIEMIKFLLDNHAKLSKNVWDYGELSIAAESNINLDVLKMFFGDGSHINDKHLWDYTPLMGAVRCNKNPEVVRFLIQKGADINAVDWEGTSVLMHAACNYEDDPTNLKILLEYGANLNAVNKKGMKAIDCAKKQYNYEIVEYLKQLEKDHEKPANVI